MTVRPRVALLSVIVAAGVAFSCKQLAGLDGDLRVEDGVGGATGSTTGSTDRGPASSSSGNGSNGSSSSNDGTVTAATTDTATTDSASTASTDPNCSLADRCFETFEDDVFDCLQDNDSGELYATIQPPIAGTLRLAAAQQTGFWRGDTNARHLHTNVGANQPFAAYTRVRVTGLNAQMAPLPNVSLAGLALRRAGQTVPDADFWMKNEAGRVQNLGIRSAYDYNGNQGEVFQHDVELTFEDVVQTGVELGICRYSNGELHAFYRQPAAWSELTFDEVRTDDGALAVGIVVASFLDAAPDMIGNFAGVLVDRCDQLDEMTCLAQLEEASLAIGF